MLHDAKGGDDSREEPCVADDHAAHGKTVPEFASWSRDSKAAAAAAVFFGGRHKYIPVAFGGKEVCAEVEPAHAQHSLANVAFVLAESGARKNLEAA